MLGGMLSCRKRRKRKKKQQPLVHNAAEGVFLNSRQWALMDHLCYVLKPFQFATREIISDDALLSQVLQSAKLQILKLQGVRPSLEGQKVCLAA